MHRAGGGAKEEEATASAAVTATAGARGGTGEGGGAGALELVTVALVRGIEGAIGLAIARVFWFHIAQRRGNSHEEGENGRQASASSPTRNHGGRRGREPFKVVYLSTGKIEGLSRECPPYVAQTPKVPLPTILR